MHDGESLLDRNEMHARRSIGASDGLVAAFLIAMQESREHQAAQELRRHQHLVGEAEAYARCRSAARLSGRTRTGDERVNRAGAQQPERWASAALRAAVSRLRGSKTRIS